MEGIGFQQTIRLEIHWSQAVEKHVRLWLRLLLGDLEPADPDLVAPTLPRPSDNSTMSDRF